ncbi:MAG: hypothetical protein RI907_1809 [Pseudomonadota bacterium]|jgi:sugar lactone lactonase YvrE
MALRKWRAFIVAGVWALGLAACGGGSGGSDGATASGRSAPTYAVGGTVAGLSAGPLVLSNGIDRFELTFDDEGVVKDRPFVVAHLPAGAGYDVQVAQQPAGVSCTVAGGQGEVPEAEVRDIQVICVKRKELSLLAGALPQYGAQDGHGLEAGFASPGAMTSDAQGNLYLVDANAVRKVTPSGVVITLAGVIDAPGRVDASGAQARFSAPSGIVADPSGRLFVADLGNDAVRSVAPNGDVATVGVQREQVAALLASLGQTKWINGAMARDGAGRLYFQTGDAWITMLAPDGGVTLRAGTSGTAFANTVLRISGLTAASDGTLYVVGRLSATYANNYGVVRLNRDDTVQVLRVFNDSRALGLAMGPDGSLWATVNQNQRTSRTVEHVAAQGGLMGRTAFPLPYGRVGNDLGAVTVAPDGRVFVIDRAQNTLMVSGASGEPATFAGNVARLGMVDGQGSEARFASLGAVARDSLGNLLVADGANGAVRRVSATGAVTTVWQAPGFLPGLSTPKAFGVAFGADDRAYVCTDDGLLLRIDAAGRATTLTKGCSPRFFFLDGAGQLTTANGCIQRYVEAENRWASVTCVNTDPAAASWALTAIDAVAPTARGYLVRDGVRLKWVDAVGHVFDLSTEMGEVDLFGDGRGSVVAVSDTRVMLLPDGERPAAVRLLDVATRTLPGALPTYVERPAAATLLDKRVVLTVGSAVYLVDL